MLRCAYHRRGKAMRDLEEQGFVIHDSYLNTSNVPMYEEYTIIALLPVVAA